MSNDPPPNYTPRPLKRSVIQTAITIGAVAFVLILIIAILLPSVGHREHGHSRANCAANLRGIANSMAIYAKDNADAFPVVPYAPYPSVPTVPKGAPVDSNPDITLNRYYKPPYPHAGTVQANLWILVLNGQVTTKQFICKTDPFATSGSLQTDAAGKYFDNFQDKSHLSYSSAYPWKSDGTVGNWWRDSTDASLPIAADMTPLQSTGKPKRNLTPATTPADPRTWNSGNHEGDGQNVAFADGHVEFVRRPDVGHNDDNIYTTSGNPSTGPAQYHGIPAGKVNPTFTSDRAPFDILLLPARNETNGAI